MLAKKQVSDKSIFSLVSTTVSKVYWKVIRILLFANKVSALLIIKEPDFFFF